MKEKYFIGKLPFKTKKDCLNYTRGIISRLGCGKITKDHPEFDFFSELLKNHLDYNGKKGVGIDYFIIQQNSFVKKYYETMIKRIDGTEIDFSWNKCCKFQKKQNTMEQLTKAMRSAINKDIFKFKQEQDFLLCCYCKCNRIEEEYQVDHENPSFLFLKSSFLQQTTQDIPLTFDEDPSSHSTIFHKENEPFEKEWKQFHNTHCNLQILCKKCNLMKKKK
jgi:hypothetical protein